MPLAGTIPWVVSALMPLSVQIRAHELSGPEKETTLRAVSEVLARHEEIVFAYAHGSFLGKGAFRDLDLALYLNPTPGCPVFLYELQIQQEITSAIAAGFPVDVRVTNRAPILFQYHAYRGRLLLDRDPDLRASIIAHVVSRYLDIKPVLEHYSREAFCREPRS